MSTPTRHPAGDASGGQFAPTTHDEPAGVALTPSVTSLDANVAHAYGVLRNIDLEVSAAEREAALTAREVMAAGDAAARQDPSVKRDATARLELADALAREAAAGDRVAHAKARLDRGRHELAVAQGRYPWVQDGSPSINLHAGRSRPVTVTPSGLFGFYEPPPDDEFAGGPRIVAIAQTIRGTWHPTAAQYTEDTIRAHDPVQGLVLDSRQGWSMDHADTTAFVQFANQEALQ